MKRILFILCVMFTGNVFAANLPDKIQCKVYRWNAVQCVDPDRPKTEPFYYQDEHGVTRVGTRKTFVDVNCVQKICSDEEGLPRGQVEVDPKYHFAVPREYYLADIGGLIYAVRDPSVNVSPVVSEAPDTKLDIWCNPQGDTCKTPKGELSREELPKHFKFADANAQGINCMQELCYNQNQDVVGLNPNYSLYQ